MGIKRFQVVLDNPTKAYFPGQNVSGNVVLIYKKECKIEGVTIEFLGRAYVYWTETGTETTGTGNDRKEERKKIEYKNEEDYFNCKINLLGKRKLSGGQQICPFSFTLPPALPSSYVGKAGQVMYQLKVNVKKDQKRDYERKITFTVNGILDLNIEPGADQVLEQRKHKNLCCFCCMSGPIGFVLILPKKGFVPGELLRFTAEMNNQSRQKVKRSKIALVQNVSFYAKGNTFRDSRIIRKMNGPGVGRGDSELWNENTFQIPAVPPTRLANCRIIDIQYNVQFEMELAGPALNLCGELPVIIGTIPFRATFREFGQNAQHLPSIPAYSEVPGPSTAATLPLGPSAPILEGYPDLPPPSYAEATNFEPMNMDPSVSFKNKFGFNNEGALQDTGEILERPYAPAYIMYGYGHTNVKVTEL